MIRKIFIPAVLSISIILASCISDENSESDSVEKSNEISESKPDYLGIWTMGSYFSIEISEDSITKNYYKDKCFRTVFTAEKGSYYLEDNKFFWTKEMSFNNYLGWYESTKETEIYYWSVDGEELILSRDLNLDGVYDSVFVWKAIEK